MYIKSMKSFSFKFPFDYESNLNGWALLTKLERVAYQGRLYSLLFDLCNEVPHLYNDLVLTSMWRSKKNNSIVGGVAESKHLYGYAIDLRFNTASHMLFEIYKSNNLSKGIRIIKEKNHYHLERSSYYIEADRSIIK